MSAPAMTVPGLAGTMTPRRPQRPVTDRRRPGQDFPTIPLPALGIEVTREQAAAVLFETYADELPGLHSTGLIATLTRLLTAAMEAVGTDGLARIQTTFDGLDAREFPEVARCRAFGHWLALAHWYDGAATRPMTVGEVAAALYLSDLARMRQQDYWDTPARSLIVSRALYQGLDRIPADLLVAVGRGFTREFDTSSRTEDRAGWSLYKQTAPDYHRRRFAHLAARDTETDPTPLLLRAGCGTHMVGITPPTQPGASRQLADRIPARPRSPWW